MQRVPVSRLTVIVQIPSLSIGFNPQVYLTLLAFDFTEVPLTVATAMPRLLAILGLIVINGFFVTAEFSIVSVRRSRIRQLVIEGDDPARIVQRLQRSLDRLLSTTQLGITLSSLALGWIGEGTLAYILASVFQGLPLGSELRDTLSHSVAIPLAFCLLAYLQIVLGELCPKAIALIYPEQLARLLGKPSVVIAQIFNPFIWILNQSTHLFLSLFGLSYGGQNWYNQVTPEELQLIISTASESIGLEEEERQLLQNIFEFGDVIVGDVMVPRTQIVGISRSATLHDVLLEVAQSGHSRYPVIGESLDDIRGILQFKELAEPWAAGSLPADIAIQSWIHPARFVQEGTPLSELLPLMKRSRQSMVIVVDEYGGTAGLTTLKDLVEEIIGSSLDSAAEQNLKIRRLDQQTFLVQAQQDLEEINHRLNLSLPLSEDYNTLGGFLIFQLQKIPIQGETIIYDGVELTVISTDGPRLHYIQIRFRDSEVGLATENPVTDTLHQEILGNEGLILETDESY